MTNKIYHMNALAIFMAIILVQTSVPGLGNIPIGPLSVTIIPITVVLASIFLGTVDGAIVGGFWGIITFIRAFWWPTSPLAIYVFTNPLVSVLPRVLVGLISGWLYAKIYNKFHHTRLLMGLVGMVGSMINTTLLLSLIYVFYRNNYLLIYHINVDHLVPYLLGVAVTNGLIEALLSFFIVPVIGLPLLKLKNRK